jgi:hypothetical protein
MNLTIFLIFAQFTQREEANPMLQKALEFFRNLPPKHCIECGEVIEEQHDCYSNQCEKCQGVTLL